MVRYETMRLAGTCDHAVAALNDPSELVVLAAIDFAGRSSCPVAAIEPLVKGGKTWRVRSRALVSLARLAPDSARTYLPAMASDPVWQARTYAAAAAKLLKDEATLAALAKDPQPNVVAAAMMTGADAVRALASDHEGLLETAGHQLGFCRLEQDPTRERDDHATRLLLDRADPGKVCSGLSCSCFRCCTATLLVLDFSFFFRQFVSRTAEFLGGHRDS
jgi:HEAT repeat protein